MLLKEIPQFTSVGNYHVDTSFNFLENALTRYLEMGLQLNPDFQRGHVWDEEKQIKYLEYIYRGGDSGRELYLNHPGWMSSYKGDFVLVDGLQRITAVRRFFAREIKIFGQYIEEFGPLIYNAMNPSFSVHVNNLKTRSEVLQWYIDLNSGGVVHTSEEIERVKALLQKEKYFEDKFGDK